MRYKSGDIVRRTDHFLEKDDPERVEHLLVLDEISTKGPFGHEYRVFILETSQILDLFLNNTFDIKHRKVA